MALKYQELVTYKNVERVVYPEVKVGSTHQSAGQVRFKLFSGFKFSPIAGHVILATIA